MSQTRARSETQGRTPAEWVSLGIALLFLGVVVGAVIFLWITSEGVPATFAITQGAVRTEGESFYLPVTITNDGDLTASQVTLEGSLTIDGTEEIVSTTFDFVPGHSEVEAVLIFQHDPSDATVTIVSYQEP